MRRFFLKIKYAFGRFMYGRNGNDGLCLVLMWVYLALWLASVILSILSLTIAQFVTSLLQLVVVGLWLFRVLSRNVAARRRECDRFFGFFRGRRNRRRDRRTHVYKKCPHCRAMLRLPKRKGRHTVCCPACHERFALRIRRNGKGIPASRRA